MGYSAACGWPENGWADVIPSPMREAMILSRKPHCADNPSHWDWRTRPRFSFPSTLLFVLTLLLVLGASGCSATGRFFGTTTWAKPLVIDDTTVVLGTKEGDLIAINLADGSELWKVTTENGRSDVRAIFGSPVTDGALVYAGGFDGSLYAVRLAADLAKGVPAGHVEWCFRPGTPCEAERQEDPPMVGGPAIDGDLIIVGFEDGGLYAVAPPSGGQPATAAWRFAAEGHIWSTPAVSNNLVIVGTLGGTLYAVQLRDDPVSGRKAGEEVWQFRADAGIGVTPTIIDDVVYFGSFDHRFYALNLSNGTSRWLAPFEAKNWFWAPPLLHAGRLYVPSLDRNLYVIDAATGTEIEGQRVKTGGAIRSSPTLIGERQILIANEAAETWWIDLTTGEARAGGGMPAPVYAPLASVDSFAYLYAQDGNLYRVSPTARQPVRVYPLQK